MVKWKDGTKNVVKLKDVVVVSRTLAKGSRITMQWGQQSWEGQVLEYEESLSDTDSDSDSDIPLARLKSKHYSSRKSTRYMLSKCCKRLIRYH